MSYPTKSHRQPCTVHADSIAELMRYMHAVKHWRWLSRADKHVPDTSCHVSVGHYVTPDAARDYKHHAFSSVVFDIFAEEAPID